MAYISLGKLYRTDRAAWEREFDRRAHGPSAQALPLRIRQHGRRGDHQAWFCYVPEIAVLQEAIMRNAMRLRSLTDSIPPDAIDEFLRACFITEIKATNDIEGVRSTHGEIRAALAADERRRLRMRFGSVVNKYRLVLFGEDIPLRASADVRRLYDEFLADEIRRRNPADLPDGRLFRAAGVDVRTGSQKVVHQGAYPESRIIDQMDELLRLAADRDDIPALIRIIIFHYFFVYIHPFYDGNGRMARFITAYQLSRELHPIIAMRLSLIIKARRADYYRLLRMTDADINRGDLTPLIIGTLELLNAAIVRTGEYLQRSRGLYQRYLDSLARLGGLDPTAAALCDALLRATLFGGMGASAGQLTAAVGKSPSTVRARLRALPPDLLRVDRLARPFLYRLSLGRLDRLAAG